MMTVTDYWELIEWQKAVDFADSVYSWTTEIPRDERFELTSQMRRATVSVPSHIAEGQGSGSTGDFARFLRMARGALREPETQVCLSKRLGGPQ